MGWAFSQFSLPPVSQLKRMLEEPAQHCGTQHLPPKLPNSKFGEDINSDRLFFKLIAVTGKFWNILYINWYLAKYQPLSYSVIKQWRNLG